MDAVIRNARMLLARAHRLDRHLDSPVCARARLSNDPAAGFIGRDSRSDNDSVSNARRAAVGDKQRQWNDKRNDKQERVNKGPARAEKRTSARQARVAYNRSTRWVAEAGRAKGREGGNRRGWLLTVGRHTRVATKRVLRSACAMTGSGIVFIAAAILPRDSRISSGRPRGLPSRSLRRSMHLEAPVRRCVVESLINWI